MPYPHELPYAWGSWQNPHKSAEQLELGRHLAEVPSEGVVVDVGAGIANGLGAAIYLARPDLTIISVDPGFVIEQNQRDRAEARQLLVEEKVSPEEGARLAVSDRWYADSRAGDAEYLPVDSDSVDLVVSYAAVPEFIDDEERAFQECVRILKARGMAVHGPIPDFSEHTIQAFETWDAILKRAVAEQVISGYEPTVKTIVAGASGRVVDANFTFLRK